MISNKCKLYICDTIIFFITTICYNFYLDAVKIKHLVHIVAIIAVAILYCRFLFKKLQQNCLRLHAVVYKNINQMTNLINLSGNRLFIILLNSLRLKDKWTGLHTCALVFFFTEKIS